MGMVYYINKAREYADSHVVPDDELIVLLKALQIKKDVFSKCVKYVVKCNDISSDDTKRGNSVTLCLGTKSYYCKEYTYFNSLMAEMLDMDYIQLEVFKKKNRKLSYEKYKSFSRRLENCEEDLGSRKGYYGSFLNYYGCLIKLIEELPDYTLIESNQRYIDYRIEKLFEFCGDYNSEFYTDTDGKYYSLERYQNIEENEAFIGLAVDIQNLCEKKNIYFDINPYGLILLGKEPVETWIDTVNTSREKKVRYRFTKYEDTYIDGHVGYHEEMEPVEIKEKTLISRKSAWINRKHSKVYETYSVIYIDGIRGEIDKEYDDYD